MLPGDQIDEQFFNAHYWRDGAGLSPLKLDSIRGDETEETWVSSASRTPTTKCSSTLPARTIRSWKASRCFRWWGASGEEGATRQGSVGRRPA